MITVKIKVQPDRFFGEMIWDWNLVYASKLLLISYNSSEHAKVILLECRLIFGKIWRTKSEMFNSEIKMSTFKIDSKSNLFQKFHEAADI